MVEAAELDVDDEAPTCSARESRIALAELGSPRSRAVSVIEDSDVISSAGIGGNVARLAKRPSYVAHGEIQTGETRTLSGSSTNPSQREPELARYEGPAAFAPTVPSASINHLAEHILGQTREEPIELVDQTALMPASQPHPSMRARMASVHPQASIRAPYRSAMMSVPPPAESWRESPWVVPSVRQASVTPPEPRRRETSMLQTIGIVGTGIVMLAIVFGAVMFARNDGDERMQFTQHRTTAAAQALPAPTTTTFSATTTLAVAAPTTFVAPTPAPVEAAPARVVVAAPAAPVKVATRSIAPPRVKEPVAPRPAPAAAPVKPKEAKAEAPAGAKKTREEQDVEALLAKLGEAQLR